MLLSKLFGKRMKDVPSEATLISHIFLLRGGYIKSVGSGIYSLLTPAVKIKRKIENIIRDEMEKLGGQEISLPLVLPSNLWERSGRFASVGKELLRFKDRSGKNMLLSMTHEEPVVDLAESFAKSYADYPFMLYQIQTKFRDEPRARGGLIRLREFTMKDAYSFHLTEKDLRDYYLKVLDSYHRIFNRVGLPEVISIESDSGMMGGSIAHEFMLLCDSGEDSVVVCENCSYKANMEVADSLLPESPGSKGIKACEYKEKDTKVSVMVFIRDDLFVNETKLQKLLGREVLEVKVSDVKNIGDFLNSDSIDGNDYKFFYDSSLSKTSDSNVFYNLYKVKEGHICPKCGSKLFIKRGIEVGNIFQLGTKYTKSMNVTYVNDENRADYAIMGCYGIGVTRLIASLIESHHDKFGPIWPKNVAPWQVHICALDFEDETVRARALKVYDIFSESFDVILDDRSLNAGSKFADADLLGVPIRIIVSKKNAGTDLLELKFRGSKESQSLNLKGCRDLIYKFYNE